MADSEKAYPNVFNIAAGQDFLAVLARGLFDDDLRTSRFGPYRLEDVQILLPTRRAARQLASAFLTVAAEAGQTALLLPRIETLGDLDDGDELAQDLAQFERAHETLPPAIKPMARHFHLLPLVTKWAELGGFGMANAAGEAASTGLNPVKLSALAYDLESFLDQAQNEQVDLARLPDLVPDELAENWQKTLGLLQVVSDYWPQYLKANDRMDPTARRNALLAEKRAKWAASPPDHPVIAAGSTGSIRATADLLKLIAGLPRGAVVLPGLDMSAEEDLWPAIEADVAHPQNMLARLIRHIDIERQDVQSWPGSSDASARADLFNLALVPAIETRRWAQSRFAENALDACHLIEAPDARSEAGAIALVMRDVMETADKTAALVTRDRNLARRVAAELRRWGIDIDDSAGRPLANLPISRLLRLVLACPINQFEPVGFLALLKHPLVRLGRERGHHLALVRDLETYLLRGPKPAGGLDGLQRYLALRGRDALRSDPDKQAAMAAMAALLDDVAQAFAPLLALDEAANLAQRLAALRLTASYLLAEQPAETPILAEQQAAAILFPDDEEGQALADLFARLSAHSDAAPAMRMADFPALMDMWLMRQTVRRQVNRTPRLAILGPLEARLMQSDVMILGGLNETVWPPMPETGPWLSRPMRAALGMSQPERQIGQAAHDFVQAAAAPVLYLTRAQKIDGAPAMAARWLRRLETLCGGLSRQKGEQIIKWWRGLDTAAAPQPAEKPAPTPALDARPDRLSVTQIETLLHNPYEIYARKILNLRPLQAVAMPAHAGHRGTFLHDLLETHIAEAAHLKPDAAARFLATAESYRSTMPGGEALLQFWQARLNALADWLARHEADRADMVAASHTELTGEMAVMIGDEPFTVTAKADRIDRLKSGLWEMIDYKTGALPSGKAVKTHLAPQLTLEAAILKYGHFSDGATQISGAAQKLGYWHLTGRDPAGELREFEVSDELVDGAVNMVERLIGAYRHGGQAYHVHIRPRQTGEQRPLADRPFDHLARLPEWQAQEGET